MSYFLLIVPVLGGIFIGYKIYRRQSVTLPLSKVQDLDIKRSIRPKDSKSIQLSPRELRMARFCPTSGKNAQPEQPKQ